jgi:hypothetical protein
VRVCPYLVYLNQDHWLANRMREEGHRLPSVRHCLHELQQTGPTAGESWSDRLTPRDLVTCGQKWLARFTPFFTAAEREHAGCQHRLFFAQVEFCDNLVFRRRAALDKLGERVLDANRTIGQPNKIITIFGLKISKLHRGKLQTEIEDLHLPSPVIRSHYRNGSIKQFVRDHLILRTEPATIDVTDYGAKKAVTNLVDLRSRLSAIAYNNLNVQQDILETFVDRGQLRKLAQPTVTPTGKRIPGLKLDNPRQLALMHCASCASPPPTASARRNSTPWSTMHSAPPSVGTLWPRCVTTCQNFAPRSWSRRYRGPVGTGSRRTAILVFLKLFERVYAPLTAGLLSPVRGDAMLHSQHRSLLDRLYQRVVEDLDRLIHAVGLKAA